MKRWLVALGIAVGFCAGNTALATAPAGRVIAAGDEWLLADQAFVTNYDSATAFSDNIATFAGGQSYLIFHDTASPQAFGSSFQQRLALAGKNVTTDNVSALSASLLQGYQAVFLTGTYAGNSTNAAILTDFVNNGGTVYIAMGTGPNAATEQSAWNPFLNAWNLNLTGSYFPFGSLTTASLLPNTSPLAVNVSSVTWGYGLEIASLSSSPYTTVLRGDFGGYGTYGVVGITGVPEPSSMMLVIFAVGAFVAPRVIRRKARQS